MSTPAGLNTQPIAPLHQQQQLTRASASTSSSGMAQRAEDIIHVLRDRVALLPGSRDRRHRPIIYIPSREANATPLNPDHIRNLFHYLYDVTADDVKGQGFVIVVDMRKGTTWSSWVKPLLKSLHDHFPGTLAEVLVIKPEKFWEKQKISAASGKYKFEVTTLSSIESLTSKYIDNGQIPREMGGSLLYDHDEWTDLRVDIEKLVWRMYECLRLFDTYTNAIENSGAPVDVATAKEAIAQHQHLHALLASASVGDLETDLQQLRRRIFPATQHDSSTSNNMVLGYPFSSPSTSFPSSTAANGVATGVNGSGAVPEANPDLASTLPHLTHLAKRVLSERIQLVRLWEQRNRELDYCFQLKLFEQDAENFCRLIRTQHAHISQNFTEVGSSEDETEHLLNEHNAFSAAINKIEVSYKQVLAAGRRLKEAQLERYLSEHTADRLEGLLSQLEEEWRRLWMRIDQRTKLLQLALSFQRKCNSFLKSSETWLSNVGIDPSSVVNKHHDEMRRALEEHDSFERVFEQVYAEAYADAMQLSKAMKKLFGDQIAGQAHSYRQVLEVIQRITQMRRQIHGIWRSRREEIHFRISSAVFITDMRSVLEWLEQHGEPFLRRKIGIGHDRASTQSLTTNHENFRAVAMNTYRNANQLFAMADDLKNTGELENDEAMSALAELRHKIDSFRRKVDSRTQLLFLASNFFLHYEEIMAWYGKLDERAAGIGAVCEQPEDCKRNKERVQLENEATCQAFSRVMSEASQLCACLEQQRMLLSIDNSGAMQHVGNLARNVETRHNAEKERWPKQWVHLNTASKVSTFLRDCSEITKQLLSWREDLKGLRHTVSNKADIVMHYHRQNTESVRNVVVDAMNQMSEIAQMIQSNDLHLMTDSGTVLAQEAVINAATQLQNLEKDVMQVASEVSGRIELSLQINKVVKLANDVTSTIQREQQRLLQMRFIPGTLAEAEQAIEVHHQFRIDCENVERMLTNFYEKYECASMPVLDPPRRQMTVDVLEQVKSKWSHLVGLIDIRTKLLNTALNFYRCYSHVIPVSESMERDLLTDQGDFCHLEEHSTLDSCLDSLLVRLQKHTQRKERFLEASLYAQKTSDTLLKYIKRYETNQEHIYMREREIMALKESVRERQVRILELWTRRKDQLELCQQSVLLRISALNLILWIEREKADCLQYFEPLKVVKAMREKNEEHRFQIREAGARCSELRDFVHEKRFDVRKLLEHCDRFLEKRPGDMHVADIEQSKQNARFHFQQLWLLLCDFEQTLKEAGSGGNIAVFTAPPSAREELSLDRCSDSTMEEALRKEAEAAVNKKMMEPMCELLLSERQYIKDLEKCINIYLHAFQTAGSFCPNTLKGKEREIFGNIVQLHDFHANTFLNELLLYERNPEDVGYCFIEWTEKLKELYADYCLNKEENNTLICLPDALRFFDGVREQGGLEHSHDLQSMVIKPVQRITRYRLMLEQLMKNCSTNAREIRDAYEIMVSIPKIANDRMHLKNFDSYEQYRVGDFIMQDAFLVSEPKRYFKRERELQVFLFESNIVFTKREEIAPKKVRYAYKDSMLLCELHVVEHVEGDNTKFGLRKGTLPQQTDLTTVLKTNTETNRIRWVKTLRGLKMDMKKSSITDSTKVPGLYRASQISRDSNTTTTGGEDRNSIASTSSHVDQYVISEDFNGTAESHLSVKAGQRVEVLDRFALTENQESIAVALVDEESGIVSRQRGYVPLRVLQPIDNDAPSTSGGVEVPANPPSASITHKRTSIRRFFNKESTGGSTKRENRQPQVQNIASHSTAAISSTHQVNGTKPGGRMDNASVLSSLATTKQCTQFGGADAAGTAAAPSSDQQPQHQQQQPPADLDLPPAMSQLSSVELDDAAATTSRSAEERAGTSLEGGTSESPAPAHTPTITTSMEQDDTGTPQGAPSTGVTSDMLSQMGPAEAARFKREYVLKELVETERQYVQDLASVVEGYIANLSSMELPEDLQGKDKIIFANIAQIHDFHQTIFLKEIEKALVDYEAAGNAFVKYERRLNAYYVKYCQNKPKSDFLVSQDSFEQFFIETKQQLGHKVALCDLLIKPVQRITKYQLMLSDILKYTQRAGDKTDVLEKALEVMRVVPKACDDMMQVGRLQNFEGNLNAQGRLLFQGTLQISDGGPNTPFRGKERRVFLFEQSAIIADCIPPRKEYGNPTYIFKNQIMVNKMVLEGSIPEEPLRFILTSNDPAQPAVFVAQASSAEDKEKWLEKISVQLDQQKTLLAALVDPKRYQNQLANTMGAMSLGGKKDSSNSLGGTPLNGRSPGESKGKPASASALEHPTASVTKSSSSSTKLFGFGGKPNKP